MDISITPQLIWFITGIILIILEFVIPSMIISFFGAGALITSLTTH